MAVKYSFKWTSLYVTIGATISKHRKKLGLSQQNLANKVELSRVSLSNIEQGRQKVSLQNLYRLTTALQLDISDLLPRNKEIADFNLEKEIKKHIQKKEKDWFVSKILSRKEG